MLEAKQGAMVETLGVSYGIDLLITSTRERNKVGHSERVGAKCQVRGKRWSFKGVWVEYGSQTPSKSNSSNYLAILSTSRTIYYKTKSQRSERAS
jgi:hypothetical protein